MRLMDGKALSAELRAGMRKETEELAARGIVPGLAVIIAGEDPASAIYVRNKIKACAETGIRSFEYRYPADVSEEELIDRIEELDADPAVHGILCQLPLPKHLDEKKILGHIDVRKDVDGFSAEQTGLLALGTPDMLPCTPAGIIELIRATGTDMCGKEAVVVGRSNIVGKPMFQLLLRNHCTVTVCHSRTRNLPEVCSRADILVVAIGKPKFVSADFVKPGALVVDVGMNRTPDGKLCGDVDFEAVKDRCSFITPVPGGVGPMTITMLMRNAIEAAKRS